SGRPDRRGSVRPAAALIVAPLAVAALAVAALLLAGCDRPPRPDASAVENSTGGTLVVATQHDITGINDLVSSVSGFSEEIVSQLFLDLFEEQPDFEEHPPTFEPRLARSWSFSDDRLALTVVLRQDVSWSDGAPVTADDVRWTWQAQTSPAVGWPYAASKERIRDVEVLDRHTARFHFTSAYAGQLADVNEGVILPRHVWSRQPFELWPESELWFQENLVVDGPFRLESWRPQEEIVLVRNPTYYEAGDGLPRLDRVVFRVVPDRSAQVTQLLRGEVDFVPRVEVEDAVRLEAADDVTLHPYWHRQYTYVGWNLQRPLFDDVARRRALTMAIDRQTIVDTIHRGYARVASSPIVSSLWAHADLEPWPYDPRRAAEILATEGWAPGADGVLARAGRRFSFTLLSNSSSRAWRDAATMIQQQLGRLGIEVLIQAMEFNTLVGRMEAHDYDAVIGAFGVDTSLDLTAMFHSEAIDDGYNFGSYENPRVDRLIEEARSQLDPLAAGPALVEIQRILHQEQPMTFLWEPQRLTAMTTRLRQARPSALSTFQGLRRWWLAR
ncbi:MAG: ABC transporter substrate-binding protein, partial [Thermoanaerobaculia bacterium]|nr:ABC transporter substrate-binding protein [Thermoanaerobaculia bacterium]